MEKTYGKLGGGMTVRRFLIRSLIIFSGVFFTIPANALTKGFEAMSFRPAADGGPYFMVYGSRNLEQWQWDVGTVGTYAYRPFQLTVAGARAQGIIDHSLVQHVYGSVGLIDRWLEVGFEVPVGWWVRWTNPNIAGSTAQNKQAIGDIEVHFKTQLLDPDDYKVGLAVLPFVSIPTGYGKYFFGNGNFAGGGKLIFEVRPIDRLDIALNAGVYAREHFDFRDIEQSHQILYGLGAAFDINNNLSLVGEFNGKTRLSGPFSEARESPAEVLGGFKYAVSDTGLTINGGGGAGVIRGAGAPTVRAFLGVNYQSPKRPPKPVPEAPKPSLDIVTGTVIYFPFDSYEITEEEGVKLGRVSDVLREYPKVKVKIVGYTDNMDGKNLNRIVSEQRAKKVKWYLELQGVDSKQMAIVGRDCANPRGDNKTSKGRAANRRVEFEIMGH